MKTNIVTYTFLFNIIVIIIFSIIYASISPYNFEPLKKKDKLTPENIDIMMLSQIPGVSTVTAKALLETYGSMYSLTTQLKQTPELLDTFYSKFKEGFDVVYAIREKRKEVFYKRFAYYIFYRILKKIANIEIPLDSGDFSFISRRVVDVLNKMPEESRFIRGMRTWIGFKQIGIAYDRQERASGDSKYSFGKLVQLALNGIYNFSEFPVKFVMILGGLAISSSVLYLISVIIKKMFFDQVIEGFTALLFVVILFGGIQLLAIGILGEYILRIFFQSKSRPNFIIETEILDGKVNKE
jgi:dolichol-phosphate mannosyltransferase